MAPPGPPKSGGCSSYQRLSKFAPSKSGPILNPGLRGNVQKTRQKGICDKNPPKTPQKWCFLGIFWAFFGFFRVFGALFWHFWPKKAIFGVFFTPSPGTIPHKTPPPLTLSCLTPRRTQECKRPPKTPTIVYVYRTRTTSVL